MNCAFLTRGASFFDRRVPMRTGRKFRREDGPVDDSIDAPQSPKGGIVLMDPAYRVLACDRGAATILRFATHAGGNSWHSSAMPKEVLESLQSHARTGEVASGVRLQTQSGEYVCRSYLLECGDGPFGGQILLALHLEQAWVGDSAVKEISAKHHLSEREEETLQGVMLGLSTKEIAELMDISPHTVKAYIRLIMIKLGATSRWGIIPKVIGNREATED
jgi:DNA-binding CsgD family transcriptional regulator